jgi:hypothetical protein
MTVRDLTIDGQGGMPCQLALRNRACALVGSIAERFLRRDKFPRNLANFRVRTEKSRDGRRLYLEKTTPPDAAA